MLRSILAVIVLIGAGAATVAGCGGSGCPPFRFPGLDVTVVDDVGEVVCGATATATDGAYTEMLTPSPRGGPCYFTGAWERPGVYTVEATFEGRAATRPDVRVTEGECHVVPEFITIWLPPPASTM
jgi:hypothetical protein